MKEPLYPFIKTKLEVELENRSKNQLKPTPTLRRAKLAAFKRSS